MTILRPQNQMSSGVDNRNKLAVKSQLNLKLAHDNGATQYLTVGPKFELRLKPVDSSKKSETKVPSALNFCISE